MKYLAPEMELLTIESSDVITTSETQQPTSPVQPGGGLGTPDEEL